jgi:hypothetical protein
MSTSARSLLRGSHLDVLSAFRPCGRDLVEFFNSTGWALHVKVAVPMRLPDAGRLMGSNLPHAGLGIMIEAPQRNVR